MQLTNHNKLRFPVGKFSKPDKITTAHIHDWIQTIEDFPIQVENLVTDLTKDELNRAYRPEGWTIQQLVHHCADSHMNSFIRFKLALTEDQPTIRPYYEDRWAEGIDYFNSDIMLSLQILTALHTRWCILLKSLKQSELVREFIHPDGPQVITVAENIGIYAWHCEHHLAHIKLALV